MEDRIPTPNESMAIIARMIEASKQRVATSDLRISIMWALLSIAVAGTVLTAGLLGASPAINLLWFAIPLLGFPANAMMARRAGGEKRVKTAIDAIHDGIWGTVGAVALLLTVVCAAFHLAGYPQAWLAMFYYAFIVVGFGAVMEGVVLKERSYRFGGLFSIVAGFVVIAMNLCGIAPLITWVLPLYMLCFLLMFIYPALVVRRKLDKARR